MPDEMRYLLFTGEELIAAVTQLCLRRGQSLPSGRVVACELDSAPDVRLRLVLRGERDDPERAVSFGATELGAALVLYCMSKRIPLPTRVEKSLQVVGGRLALALGKGLRPRPLGEVAILDHPG